MRHGPDQRPGPLALDLMAINQIKDECDELAALWAELKEHERERMMALLFGSDL